MNFTVNGRMVFDKIRVILSNLANDRRLPIDIAGMPQQSSDTDFVYYVGISRRDGKSFTKEQTVWLETTIAAIIATIKSF